MQLVIFDLDGTLIDSKLDLAHAVNATRAYMGLEPLPHELIATYVGNGAPVLIRRALGPAAPQDDVDRALEYFLAYYREHMLDYTRLYDGVPETLSRFAAAGRKLAVLTNKPVRVSNEILKGLGIRGHFFQVYGGNSFEEKKPSPIGIRTLVQEAGAGLGETLMVGDSAVDIRTARNARVRSAGVTYGFQPETLRDTPPDYLLDTFRELEPLVLD